MTTVKLVSVHGGHSGQFCSHSRDRLEEMVVKYIDQGFAWVGITEHMPAVCDEMVPPEEVAAGLDAQGDLERFADYMATGRALQLKYEKEIGLFIGFETEAYDGYRPFVQMLLDRFQPDYIVGSVHHINNLFIDATPELFAQTAALSGGIDQLYCDYFDKQLELIEAFRPAVVGHFDLVRLLDPDYKSRIQKPPIWQRICRNLKQIKHHNLTLDFNVRALDKGQDEPYISHDILRQARELDISVIPGDDSHGVAGVGRHVPAGIGYLQRAGFDTNWLFNPLSS